MGKPNNRKNPKTGTSHNDKKKDDIIEPFLYVLRPTELINNNAKFEVTSGNGNNELPSTIFYNNSVLNQPPAHIPIYQPLTPYQRNHRKKVDLKHCALERKYLLEVRQYNDDLRGTTMKNEAISINNIESERALSKKIEQTKITNILIGEYVDTVEKRAPNSKLLMQLKFKKRFQMIQLTK